MKGLHWNDYFHAEKPFPWKQFTPVFCGSERSSDIFVEQMTQDLTRFSATHLYIDIYFVPLRPKSNPHHVWRWSRRGDSSRFGYHSNCACFIWLPQLLTGGHNHLFILRGHSHSGGFSCSEISHSVRWWGIKSSSGFHTHTSASVTKWPKKENHVSQAAHCEVLVWTVFHSTEIMTGTKNRNCKVLNEAWWRGLPPAMYSAVGSASEVEGLGDSGLGFFSWANWMGTAIWLRSMVCCLGLDSPFSFTVKTNNSEIQHHLPIQSCLQLIFTVNFIWLFPTCARR